MRSEIKYAFVRTVPVLLGYLFLGIAFGLLLEKAGYHAVWAFFISLFVYAGSMQFVLVNFLSGGTGLITAAVMTLLINSRHAFYGLSFIEKFKKMGKLRPYMIFSLTDETYSLLCAERAPKDLDENKVMFWIAVLNHSYWILGSVLGSVLGQLITFNTSGIDFAMTALFVVIFIEQWYTYASHVPVYVGAASGIASLLWFGPDNFILPALLLTVTVLMLLRPKLDGRKGEEAH
ncbi:AzlC family ABC transporter permease [Lachnotalea sp. AF33-28]|uniref:AzlC family ABC transporter permease n=1 Tax=Lachnotalea sp. AF33-28 TaxID=2292046 RepID=UPI000E518E3B|nr:AzlC family ABC transporter permease [Lachnotalea sp. AF33-28]RHP32776.1 branched-chain amino acid ABC transporter permease [Lachnotalea sp. AF33-28]